MNDVYTYQIEISGQVSINDFNTSSPIQVSIVRVNQDSTLLTICADQSGLIGLLRHLHGLGFTLLSVNREPITIAD